MKNRIFSTDSPKAIKAQSHGYLNAIQYLAPHKRGGAGNLCSHASEGCIALCLGEHSGAATYYASVLQSRIAKARRFMRDRQNYLIDVAKAIAAAERKALSLGLKLCVRLNGSSDIAWEMVRFPNGQTLFDLYPHIQFVDYTKNPLRFKRALPANYQLTFSHSEINHGDCMRLLAAGHNVAVVFAGHKPSVWCGYPVVDGDLHDLRHLDPHGVVIGLSPKGHKARKDKSGFVVRSQAPRGNNADVSETAIAARAA